LVYENVYMVISLPTKRISVISQWKTFIRVLPTRWRRKPAGIEFTSLLPYADITCSELCSIVKFEFDQSFYSTTNATSRLCAIHGHVSMCVWCVFYCLSVTSRCSIQRATDIITQNSIPHKSDIKRFNWYCQTSCSVVTDTPTVHPNFTIAVNKTRSSAIAEGPRDASCTVSWNLANCQWPRNSAETTSTTSPEPSISCR